MKYAILVKLFTYLWTPLTYAQFDSMEKLMPTNNGVPVHNLKEKKFRLNFARIVFLLLLLLSVFVRLYRIDGMLIEQYGFRQCQTAITVWTFMEEGPKLLTYQTPVLGPPWRIPMEFPVFQLVAYIVAKTGYFDLDMSCRLTNILFFYLSAFSLGILASKFFGRKSAAVIVLTYVWFPYTIFWSRTCMIDFASAFFALMYMYYYLLWLYSPKRTVFAIIAILWGILAYLTKVTTMPAFVFIIGILVVYNCYKTWFLEYYSPVRNLFAKINWRNLIIWIGISIIPIVTCIIWIKYSDYVKGQSPLTAWLTSDSLHTWNFFSLDQLKNRYLWQIVLTNHSFSQFLKPIWLGFFIYVALSRAYHLPTRSRLFLYSSFLGIFVPLIIHFNLYRVHSYYAIAISPLFAIILGYGISEFYSKYLSEKRLLFLLIVLLVFSSAIVFNNNLLKPYGKNYISHENHTYLKLKALVDSSAQQNDEVLIFDCDWSSEMPYYLQRKALLVRKPIVTPDKAKEAILSSNIKIAICRSKDDNWFSSWPSALLVGVVDGWQVFKINPFHADESRCNEFPK